eukprot:CAMPEP_0174743326 /NCGR_PEP_ID=MMETSP1094-20130205/81342_1 /TAXON_ID=156173 /ORGANISM="Chrysochromulina brevifilum, Strain UTEX LB 985" /LENGTH=38 /DNA_ID= /DNA_START= /DNA_END= /DNA_ORIENTATION=
MSREFTEFAPSGGLLANLNNAIAQDPDKGVSFCASPPK